jgi:hypothetical protein
LGGADSDTCDDSIVSTALENAIISEHNCIN